MLLHWTSYSWEENDPPRFGKYCKRRLEKHTSLLESSSRAVRIVNGKICLIVSMSDSDEEIRYIGSVMDMASGKKVNISMVISC